jgi:hypothetical protein
METFVLIHSVKERSFFVTSNEKYAKIKIGQQINYEEKQQCPMRQASSVWKLATLIYRGKMI